MAVRTGSTKMVPSEGSKLRFTAGARGRIHPSWAGMAAPAVAARAQSRAVPPRNRSQRSSGTSRPRPCPPASSLRAADDRPEADPNRHIAEHPSLQLPIGSSHSCFLPYRNCGLAVVFQQPHRVRNPHLTMARNHTCMARSLAVAAEKAESHWERS